MHPLMCWDIVLNESLKRSHSSEVAALELMKREFSWHITFVPILRKQFDALVITDVKQKIQWTSAGFEKMTGYSSAFALHKKPSFLQGKESSKAAKQKLRDGIRRVRKMEVSIINYKKDGSLYHCHIEIIPLVNKQRKLTHFLAIEKEIPLGNGD